MKSSNNRTAIVFGATGMIGSYLVEELIQNMRYTAIKVFTRRPLDLEHIKLIEKIVDIENIDSYREELRGDDLFICLGTTMRKARSVKRYEEIDRDLPLGIVKACIDKGLQRGAVVSSIGARENSRSYYSRIKGEMEAGFLRFDLERSVVVRPSLLLGDRKEFRLLEGFGKLFARLFSLILIGKLRIYRAIHGRDVALAMIELLGEKSGKNIYQSDELQDIASIVIKQKTTNNSQID